MPEDSLVAFEALQWVVFGSALSSEAIKFQRWSHIAVEKSNISILLIIVLFLAFSRCVISVSSFFSLFSVFFFFLLVYWLVVDLIVWRNLRPCIKLPSSELYLSQEVFYCILQINWMAQESPSWFLSVLPSE